MAAATKISWTEKTWNPLAGCSVTSPGCKNCYAMRMAARLENMRQQKYVGLTKPSNRGAVWTGEVRLDRKALDQPLSWRTPTVAFVNSMSDLFHDNTRRADIDDIMATICATRQHTFQILTKRSERMRQYMSDPETRGRVTEAATRRGLPAPTTWPPENAWLGVSVEDGAPDRVARIDDLRATPAAIRFISFEPLIGRVGQIDLTGIDWAIIGGESGVGARPMELAWAIELIDQARSQGTAIFFKQLGKILAGTVGLRGKAEDPALWPEAVVAQLRGTLDLRGYPTQRQSTAVAA